MKLVFYDPGKKIVFFEKNNQLYKAKILSQDSNSLQLHLYNTNQTITIPLQKNTKKNSQNTQPSNVITSPISGRVIKTHVQPDQFVQKDHPLITIESMKMENEIRAPFNLFVKTISINELDLVKQNQLLLKVKKK